MNVPNSPSAKYLAYVLQATLAVEQQFGSTIPGASKKLIVMGELDPATPGEDITAISAQVDRTVKAFNDGGVFIHNSPAGRVIPAPK